MRERRLSGLSSSSDMGCNWSCAGGALAGQGIADVVARSDAPHNVLALMSTTLLPDAGGGTRSQVFESVDGGATWMPLGVPLDSTVRVGTMGVAKTDPRRLYVSGVRGYGANSTVSLFVSTDSGATWVEHALPQFDPSSEYEGDVAGVDPTDADRVYLRSAPLITGGRRRLFVTTDGGQSFTTLLSIQAPAACCDVFAGERLSLVLSPDGAKIFVGNPQGGLWIADRADMTFSQVSPVDIHCLAMRATATGGTELWACSDEYSAAPLGPQFDVGVLDRRGRHVQAQDGDADQRVRPDRVQRKRGRTVRMRRDGQCFAMCRRLWQFLSAVRRAKCLRRLPPRWGPPRWRRKQRSLAFAGRGILVRMLGHTWRWCQRARCDGRCRRGGHATKEESSQANVCVAMKSASTFPQGVSALYKTSQSATTPPRSCRFSP